MVPTGLEVHEKGGRRMNILVWLGKNDPELTKQALLLVKAPPPAAEVAAAKAELKAAKARKYVMTPEQIQRATRLTNTGGRVACEQYLREEENRFTDSKVTEVEKAEKRLDELLRLSRGLDGLLLDAIRIGLAELSKEKA